MTVIAPDRLIVVSATHGARPIGRAAAKGLMATPLAASSAVSTTTVPLLERMQLLLAAPLFADLHPEELLDLAGAAELVTFAPGERIVNQGNLSEDVHLIVDGTVQIVARDSEGDTQSNAITETIIGWLSAGDTVGELAVLSQQPSQSSYIALVTTTCLQLQRSVLIAQLQLHWSLADALLRGLSRRLQCAERRLATSDRDTLTGLTGRATAAEFYERHVAIARRASYSADQTHISTPTNFPGISDGKSDRVRDASLSRLTMLVAVVDQYLNLAERHGRQAADAVLRTTAAALSSVASRSTDLVARTGLDEFVVVLPGADAAGAEIVTARLDVHFGKCTTQSFPAVPFTVRTGIAEANFPQPRSFSALAAKARMVALSGRALDCAGDGQAMEFASTLEC